MIRLISIADNDFARETGLMGIRKLAEDQGMLFMFPQPRVLNFWMKDTPLTLDIAFLDRDGVVVKTERMAPYSLRTVSSGHVCTMALEVPAGGLDKAGCAIGKRAVVDTDKMTVAFEDCL